MKLNDLQAAIIHIMCDGGERSVFSIAEELDRDWHIEEKDPNKRSALITNAVGVLYHNHVLNRRSFDVKGIKNTVYKLETHLDINEDGDKAIIFQNVAIVKEIPWSAKRPEFVIYYNPNHPADPIHPLSGAPESSMSSEKSESKKNAVVPLPYSSEIRKKVLAALLEGKLSNVSIAKKFGISAWTVGQWAKKAGIKARLKEPVHNQIAESKKQKALDMLREGKKSYRQIADELGVSKWTIWNWSSNNAEMKDNKAKFGFRHKEDARKRAVEIYQAEMHNLSQEAIAAKAGVNRKTLMRWVTEWKMKEDVPVLPPIQENSAPSVPVAEPEHAVPFKINLTGERTKMQVTSFAAESDADGAFRVKLSVDYEFVVEAAGGLAQTIAQFMLDRF